MLVIALPHHSHPTPLGYSHVDSDGFKVLRQGHASAQALSQHAGEVVGVVPATRLSWMALDLPPVSTASKRQQVVHSLLEEQLLQDSAELHIVLPNTHSTQGGACVVAICDKAWLREVLAPLNKAGVRVQRLVAELCPTDKAVLHVMGSPDQSLCALTHPRGVTLLPPNTEQWPALGVSVEQLTALYAEPAMTERVQALLAREPALQTAAQRWLATSTSAWDLAQGEWAQGRAQRWLRDAKKLAQDALHAPAWRPVRWGCLCLLLVQVIGLNALAWQESQLTKNRQDQLKQLLLSTFPKVNAVIDAPLQMQREAARLQQSLGAIAGNDLEFMLHTLGHALPDGLALSSIDYSEGVLKLSNLPMSEAQQERLQQQLQAAHLTLERDAHGAWLIQTGVAP